MTNVSLDPAPAADRLYPPDSSRPLPTWIWTSFVAIWVAGTAHEAGHVAVGLPLRALSDDTPTAWMLLSSAAAGPGVTWAIVLSSCFLLGRGTIVSSVHRFLPFIAGLGFAASSRFLLLGAVSLALVAGGRPGPRGDEFRISSLVGVPQNVLLFSQLFAALLCVVYLSSRLPKAAKGLALTGMTVGIVCGWIAWFTVAEVFDVAMMR